MVIRQERQTCNSFFGPLTVVGRLLWNKVCPSFRLSFRLSGCFLGIVSLPNMVLETHLKLCATAGFSRNVFAPKIRKMGQKQGLWNLLKNFVITFFWICSIMKIYIISCVPAQIPYLEKYWFLRYRPKCSQPIRLQDFLINHISRTNQWNSLIFYMLTQLHIN